MTTSTTPLLASTDGPHHIDPRNVYFDGGPLAGNTERIARAHTIDGLEAIASFHGEGFYWLPESAAPASAGLAHAVWEPHADARFAWSRYV
jgi:hypothetical protein